MSLDFFIRFLAYQNFKISHDQSAFIKIHLIALNKSHFLIWTNWKNLSIENDVHMDNMKDEVNQDNSIT